MGPNNLVASELSSQAAVVRSHVNGLNKFLQASPEGQPKPKHKDETAAAVNESRPNTRMAMPKRQADAYDM